MSNNDIRSLANTIQRLQARLGEIRQHRMQADGQMANCQTQINLLNNNLVTIRNQASPGQFWVTCSSFSGELTG